MNEIREQGKKLLSGARAVRAMHSLESSDAILYIYLHKMIFLLLLLFVSIMFFYRAHMISCHAVC